MELTASGARTNAGRIIPHAKPLRQTRSRSGRAFSKLYLGWEEYGGSGAQPLGVAGQGLLVAPQFAFSAEKAQGCIAQQTEHRSAVMAPKHLAVLPEAVIPDMKKLVLDAPVAPQQPLSIFMVFDRNVHGH